VSIKYARGATRSIARALVGSWCLHRQQVLEWLNMDETQRPSIITVYFEGVDTAGHEHGPWGAEVYEAMSAVDDAIGTLLDGVEASSVAKQVHVVLVSDHGMAPIDPSRCVWPRDSLPSSHSSYSSHSSHSSLARVLLAE